MQMESIYLWATALPEAIGMDVWRHAVRNFLEASLKRAVAEDGSHWEQSIGYHRGCIRWYGTPVLLARRNGEPFADEYVQRLHAMGEFLDSLVTPDGQTPLLSDSDRTPDWRGGLAMVKCLAPDARFDHAAAPRYYSLWASDGFEWPVDEPTHDFEPVRVFSDAGLAVLRHPKREKGAMLLLDNGPTLAGHAHLDNLNVQYEALGKPIIVDPGRWVYTKGDPDRHWVLQTHSHNCIHIEDTPIASGDVLEEALIQRVSATDDPRLSPIAHEQRGGVVKLQTAFRAYTADPQARVERTVWMPVQGEAMWFAVLDRIEAPTEHTWTNSWLLPAEAAIEQGSSAYAATLTHGLHLQFAAAGSETLQVRDDAKFWCPNYAEKSPARWVRFSSKCEQGWRAFVFVPGQAKGTSPDVAFDGKAVRITVAGQAIACEL